MTYQEAESWLYKLESYYREGKVAYHPGLVGIERLCQAIGNPHKKIKTVHVAGTNGKGSSSHMLASVLQESGYKTGLYTSPHLKSFRERMRVNGQPISGEGVATFVEKYKALIEETQPSFFEVTVAMAFECFANEQVDIAIIEVGLGGRLDATNIIIPEISLITNIGLDHTNLLGDTLGVIAAEKAGIIKPGVPVVIGETHPETEAVFKRIAIERQAPITFADQQGNEKAYSLDLKGNYQQLNLKGVLQVIGKLRQLGWTLSEPDVEKGLSSVISNTGLKGRWQQLSDNPVTICDTGHNREGIELVIEQLKALTYDRLYLILGFVDDKDVDEILKLIPEGAELTFCGFSQPRALTPDALKAKAEQAGFDAESAADVNRAFEMVRKKAGENDLIFVGGSTFVVAELNEL
ncbi:MAG: folylpolyglutamate synthase/dihydrofolate synthase family protein [Roseivirga sp.]